MNRKIRLIWDFYGEKDVALKTGEHHVIHLLEFMNKENISYYNQGTQATEDFHIMAYITIGEEDVKIVKNALKPNRAFVEKMD